ncbi:mitochondrial carrier [Violaceomyces palustris]|uniref:Mitochondrial carrier n=1 Tax=Violaceomyces palustris TaxID=1673888 RepID=A0ACD0P6G9_9BASI|nr:mitochondrial carrier [Violaceomyces palustris]
MAASDRPNPLRPYNQPQTFSTSSPSFSKSSYPSSSSSTASASTSTSSPSSSRQPFSFQTTNRYSSNDKPYVASVPTSPEDRQPPLAEMLKALMMSGALQYTSTCLAMPFEVGKLLLQIQWVPTDQVWMSVTRDAKSIQEALESAEKVEEKTEVCEDEDEGEGETGKQDTGDPVNPDWQTSDIPPEAEEWQDQRSSRSRSDFGDLDELSDEEEAEAYFRDLSSQPNRTKSYYPSKRTSKQRTDSSGYVMRSSIHDSITRPEFVMPVVVRGGVWEMIKAVGRGKEGWLGLWKGCLTTFIMDLSTSTLQPIVSTLLSFLSPSALSPLPLAYSPYPYKTLGLLLSSHLITGILVSPLDLVRTRLVAQSTLPYHRKYKGPVDAFKKMLQEEGGWRTAYLHPNLLIPTILDFTLRPLLSLSTPLIIERTLRLDSNTSPVMYSIAELGLSTLSLIVTLPIETVRRRLQIQMRRSNLADRQTRPKDGVKEREGDGGEHGGETKKRNTRLTSKDLRDPNRRKMRNKSRNPTSQQGGADGGVRSLRTCVETRPVHYVGVVEAIYRILTEETSTSSSAARGGGGSWTSKQEGEKEEAEMSMSMSRSGIIAKAGNSSLGGLRSLYRGFGMGLGANLMVFMLTLVSGERAGPTGWAEM